MTATNPDGLEWSRRTKLGDVDVPCGPLCQGCHDAWQNQFPIFETEGEFIAYAKQPKAKTELQETQRINQGGKKTIADEQVYEVVERGITIPRPYVFFTSSEYKQQLCTAPQGKRWPKISMPCEETGQEELLWYFRDDGRPINGPHRKGEMWVRKVNSSTKDVMPVRFHRYKGQSEKNITHQTKKCGFDAMNRVSVLTIAGEHARVKTKEKDDDDEGDGDEMQPESTANLALVGVGQDAISVDQLLGPEASCGSGGRQRASLEAPTDNALVAVGDLGSPVRLTAAALKTLPATSPATFSVGSDANSEEPADDDDDDLLFGVEDDDQEKLVRKAVHNLCCSKALDEKEIDNATNELVNKLAEKEIDNAVHLAILRGHRATFEIAKKSNIKLIQGLSDEDFRANITKIKSAKVQLSSSYKTAVFRKSVNARLQSFSSAGSIQETEVHALLKDIKPFSAEESEYDPLQPRLADLEASGNHKFGVFQHNVLQRMFVPLIATGANSADIVLSMCKPLIKDFEEINGELELSDQCMHIIVDCLTIWRALLATGSNTLDLSNPEDLEMYTNAVLTMLEMSAQTSSRNMKAVVGQVIVSNDFWGNKFKDFMTVEPNSRTCCPS
jgi:hypothetical protein